ncbi:MAG: glycosyltransferase family 2 protein [Ottowia sp.]|nr:glycosyltransferase family 2 protein [Ottowia sp.]
MQILGRSRVSLSVVIITCNEAINIGDCIRSLGDLATEVIVVDSGSTDDTIALARAAGAQVVSTTLWPGFGPQKNYALTLAQCDWVLSLDADERLTPLLREYIVQAIQRGDGDGYWLPRRSYFLGQPVRYCGWYPDNVLRLFRRTCGRFSDDLVHERVVLTGKSAWLREPLLHYSYRHRDDVARKVAQYASAGAQQLFMRGKRSTPMQAVLRAAWAFVRTYFLKMGILDGQTGWGIAHMNRRVTYYKYKKLIDLYKAVKR